MVSVYGNMYVIVIFHYIKKLNCWETLKPCGLQRGDENPVRECGESRKNRTDGGEVKTPAAFYNGQSAAKPR